MGVFQWLTRRREVTIPPRTPARVLEPPSPLDVDALPQVLGFELPPVIPWEPAREEEVAQQVLQHFRKHRPPPASFPGLSLRVLELAAREDIDARTLANTVQQDQALSAAILRVANSALMRGASAVGDVREAIARLGTREVTNVASVVSVRALFNPDAKSEFQVWGKRWNGLFHHGATTAFTAGWLALRMPGVRSDQVMLSGMLHDVGKSVALKSLAALVREGAVQVDVDDPLVDRVLHRVHLEIGGWLHLECKLPEHSRTVCVRHHDEEQPRDVTLVKLVSSMYLLRSAPSLFPEASGELVAAASSLGLDAHALRELAGEQSQASDRLCQLFGVAPLIPRQSPNLRRRS